MTKFFKIIVFININGNIFIFTFSIFRKENQHEVNHDLFSFLKIEEFFIITPFENRFERGSGFILQVNLQNSTGRRPTVYGIIRADLRTTSIAYFLRQRFPSGTRLKHARSEGDRHLRISELRSRCLLSVSFAYGLNSGSAFAAAAFNRFVYNDRSELNESARYLGTDVNILTSPVTGEYRNFTYDPIGNRTNITVAANNGTYSANNLNQYSTENVAGGGANTFTYDDDGNLTAISGNKNVQYVFNAENQVITMQPATPVLNDKKVESVYDFQGRRVQKIVSNWTGVAWVPLTTKRFVYDGWNVLEEQTVAGTSKYYVWGLDLSQSLQGAGGVGGLLTMFDGVGSYAYFYDGNGNVGQMVNNVGGAIAAHYEYDPYGNSIVATGSQAAGNPYRFSTKYLDTEYNLYYYGYRYYDPATGRWLSRDPIEEEGGINLYLFVLNNAINHLDALGHTYIVNWYYLEADFIMLGIDISTGNVPGAVAGGIGLTYDLIAGATALPPIPGVAVREGIVQIVIKLRGTSPLAINMRKALEAGKENVDDVIRYAVTELDNAHHIITQSIPKRLDKSLISKLECIQNEATKALGSLDNALNGVSLRTSFHRLTSGIGDTKNTLQEWYYLEVIKRFEGLKGDDLIRGIQDFADDLLKMSEKK